MMRSLGLLLSFGLLVSSTAVAQECFPECRDGYLCHEGQCIESCNPPCKDGKVCTKGGQCAPDVAAAPSTKTDVESTAPIPDGSIVSFGVGPTIGEFYGGIVEFEVDMRNLAVQFEGGGGINGDGNSCIYGGLSAGKRSFFNSTSASRGTLFIGAFGGYLSENEEIEYALAGLKLMTGYSTFASSGMSAGVDIGFKVGYRTQLSDTEYGEDYSGITGGLEARYRFGF